VPVGGQEQVLDNDAGVMSLGYGSASMGSMGTTDDQPGNEAASQQQPAGAAAYPATSYPPLVPQQPSDQQPSGQPSAPQAGGIY